MKRICFLILSLFFKSVFCGELEKKEITNFVKAELGQTKAPRVLNAPAGGVVVSSISQDVSNLQSCCSGGGGSSGSGTGDLYGTNLYLTGATIQNNNPTTNLNINPSSGNTIILDGLSWPIADGAYNTALVTDGAGNLSFTFSQVGDVRGPESSVLNTIPRYEGITGKIIKNSNVFISAQDDLIGVQEFEAEQVSTKTVLSLNSNTLDILASSSITIKTDGTNQNVILLSENGDISLNGMLASQLKGFASSGVLYGGKITVNADPSKIDISAGAGLIVDNFTTPNNPTYTLVTWAAKTGVSVTNIASSDKTYVALDSSGNVDQSVTEYSYADRRDKIILGNLVHTNNTSVASVWSSANILTGQYSQHFDLIRALGPINISGNAFAANGANLNINKSSGQIYAAGVNYDQVSGAKVPDIRDYGAATAPTFLYAWQSAPGIFSHSISTAVIDPAQYDTGSGLGAVPAGEFSTQRIYMLLNGDIIIQYGQATYATLSAAEDAISTEAFLTDPLVEDYNAAFRAWLIVKQNTVDLSNAAEAKFVAASNLAGLSGASGGGGGGAGNVTGPVSATDEAVVRFDGASGNLIQNSGVKIDDSDNVTGINDLTVNGQITGYVIGTNIQAYDDSLQSIAGLIIPASPIKKIIYSTDTDTFATWDIAQPGLNILDDPTVADQRNTLGLGTMATQNSNNVNITGGSISGTTISFASPLPIADGGTSANTIVGAQTALNLLPGTDVQEYDAGLQSISGLVTSADKMIYTTAADTYAVTDLTAAGRALLDDTSAAAQRITLGLGTIAIQNSNDINVTGGKIDGVYITSGSISNLDLPLPIGSGGTNAITAGGARTSLGLAIGSDVLAYSTSLQNISGITPADSRFIVGDGDTWVGEDPTTARTSLGLGTIATQNANNVAITGGSATGLTNLEVDNIRIDGNKISSLDLNGSITLEPNGTGTVVIDGLLWPQSDGTAGQFLSTDGSGNLSFVSAGGGDVSGPGAATVNALPRFGNVGGTSLLNSGVTLDGSDQMSGITRLDVDNIRVDGNTISATDVDGDIILTPNGDGTVNLDGLTSDQLKDFASTGLLTGGIVSINGGDASKIDISAGSGLIVDNFTDVDNPTLSVVSWAGFSGVAVTGLASDVSFVAINSSGNVIQSSGEYDYVNRRDVIVLATLVHTNQTTLDGVFQVPSLLTGQYLQHIDLARALGPINIAGNEFSANGANLNINKSAGDVYAIGVNYDQGTGTKVPDVRNYGLNTGASFLYSWQTSPGVFDHSTSIDLINSNSWDTGSGLGNVSTSSFTAQRIYMFLDGEILIQYGQTLYDSLSEAQAALATESFTINPLLKEYTNVFRGWLIVKGGTTALNNIADAKFISAGKFSDSSSSGGASGDVSGPASATDNALVRFDGSTGNFIKNSVVILDNSGNMSGVQSLTADNVTANEFYGTIQTANQPNITNVGTLNNVSITGGSITGITDLAIPDGGTGASDAPTARFNLGLEIDTDVQRYNDALESISTLSPIAAGNMIYTTAVNTFAVAAITAAGRALLDDADAAAQRTTLGLGSIATQNANNINITGGTMDGVYITSGSISQLDEPLPIASGGTGAITAGGARATLGLAIGSDVLAYSTSLQNISNITPADSIFIVGDGTTWVGEDAATARTSLGLGTMAIQNANNVAITGGSATGLTQLEVDNIRIDGNTISSLNTDGDINLTPNGDGAVVLDGLSWPITDGTNGQVLSTNGAGQLSFIDNSGGGGSSGDAFVSVFGDLIVGERSNSIAIMFQYNLPTDLINTTSVRNGGTATQQDGYLRLSSGSAANGESTVQSRQVLHYNPGHEGYALFTSAFINGGIANSRQLIGLYDDKDGWAVGFNGTAFSVLYRDNMADTYVSQANFNLDKLDGTGSSGFTIDPTKINIFKITYGWLGTAPVTFYVWKPDGNWVAFHRFQFPNSRTTPTVENPTLPIRAEATNLGNTTNLELRTVCWNAGLVGETKGLRSYSILTEGTSSKTVDKPIISIRNKDTFATKINKTTIQAIGANFGVAASRLTRFKIFKNATLTGAAFVDYNSQLSAVQIDTSATVQTGGTLVFATMSSLNSLTDIFFKTNDFDLLLQPGETWTITARTITNATDIDINFIWEEIY
ncbi:MAG: hypothetical protein UR26_C0002G0005 [candidate division TM6 bacterium GW2011_GWF2_32_72]|nr:MAG: hypothetical protein UR26_C0002G0005 [candidate division TM6 bacterium GW2011_GWF2_32_72]